MREWATWWSDGVHRFCAPVPRHFPVASPDLSFLSLCEAFLNFITVVYPQHACTKTNSSMCTYNVVGFKSQLLSHAYTLIINHHGFHLCTFNFVKIKSSFSFKGIYASNGVNSKCLCTLCFTFESNGCDWL